MKSILVLAVSFALQEPSATESQRQKVVDRLKAVSAAFAGAESISYEVEMTSRRASDANPPRVEKSRVSLKRPNVGRIEDPRGNVRIADGKEMWIGGPANPTYSRLRLNPSTFNRYFHSDYLVNQLFFIKDPVELLRKQGDITLEKGKIDATACAILCWKGINSYGRVSQLRLWIGDDNLPRRVERTWEQSIMGSGGMFQTIEETYEISNLALNPALGEDTFVFTPAKAATEHDLIEVNSRGPLPEGAEEATAILEGIRTALKKVDSIEYTVEIKLEGAKVDPKLATSRRRVRVTRPDLVRIDTESPAGDKTVLVDGEWTWTFEKEKKTYLRTWLLDPFLSTGPDNDPWFRLFWERRPTRVFVRGRDVKVSREKLGDVDCTLIRWIRDDNYAVTAAGGGKYEVLWKFWIDLDGNPKRVTKSQEHGDVAWTETCTYGPIDRKAKNDPEAFKFAPAEGWKSSGGDIEDYMLAVGAPAPAVGGTSLEGKPIKLADYKGKAVVLTFWEAGSPFCAEELDTLAKLHKEHAKRGAVFLLVSRESSPQTVSKYLKANDLPFTAVVQKPFEISAAFGIRLEPTTYLIDREGVIAGRWICIEEEELRQALDKALGN